MQLVRRFRLPALFCAFAVLACALISRPYADMGICDEGPYFLMAQHLARTGHIVFNGWATAMLGCQLYLGAAFIKLFGASFTAVRMSTLMVALLTAFFLQRTLVLAGVNERNATLGTLAFVLSPLYLELSVTFMTDAMGLCAVVLCLYGCLRALHASAESATIAWLCFSVVTNAVFGTSRQIAWLGILVMAPSALYLLGSRGGWRARHKILAAGAVVTAAGVLFIFVCMQWLKRQPYSIPEHLVVPRGAEFDLFSSLLGAFAEIPFLLIPIAVLFLPELRKGGRRSVKVVSVASATYVLVPLASYHLRGYFHFPHLLEPTMGDWFTPFGGYGAALLTGPPAAFLHTGTRVVLTIASLGGLLGLIVSLLEPRPIRPETGNTQAPPWRELRVLVGPFVAIYCLLLIPRAASVYGIFDRYLLELLAVALPWLVLIYQERIRGRMPPATLLLIAIWAVYSIAITHNMFSFYRARAKLADELRAHGIPDTRVDNGWEYNFMVELRHSDHINDPRIAAPSGAYVPVAPLPSDSCPMFWFGRTPHVRPIYGVSFDPNACYGPAPFAPVHYSRWLASSPGTLYVVRYLPAEKK